MLRANGLKIYEEGDPNGELTVVFLHGYGATGRDLIPLAGSILWPRSTRFLFPEAPLQLDQFPFDAYAWFPFDLNRLDKMFEEGGGQGLLHRPPEALASVKELIKAFKELKLDLSKTIVAGFSQGAMMALEVCLSADTTPLAACLFSTTPVGLPTIRERAKQKKGMRFFQSHGHYDQLLPFAFGEVLFSALVEEGWLGKFHLFEGDHEIDVSTLKECEAFIHELM